MSKSEVSYLTHDGSSAAHENVAPKPSQMQSSQKDLTYLGEQGKRQQFKARSVSRMLLSCLPTAEKFWLLVDAWFHNDDVSHLGSSLFVSSPSLLLDQYVV